jgi:hypothetical protein
MKLRFEEKNAECEQIVMVLHRTRNELNKKLEKQQKEHENKINFLIQQLRNTEVRLHENSLLLRSSYDSKLLLEGRNRGATAAAGGGEGGSGEGRDEEEEIKRPHTASAVMTTGVLEEREREREERRRRPHTGPSVGGEGEEEGEEEDRMRREQEENMKLINDLKRKLDTERHRREILEKRNGEIMRELRKQRDNDKNTDKK